MIKRAKRDSSFDKAIAAAKEEAKREAMLEHSKALRELDIRHGSEKEYLVQMSVELEKLIEHYRREYTRLMLLMESGNANKKENRNTVDHCVSNEEVEKYCRSFEQRCKQKDSFAKTQEAIEQVGRAFGKSSEEVGSLFAQLAGYSSWLKNR